MAIFYQRDLELPPISEKPRNKITTPSQKREELSEEVLSNITNREFLNIQKNERLKHITKPQKDAESLKTWDDITFKFKFWDKLNSDLYLKTTIGQVMPPQVKEVIANGTTWIRSGYEWEFFTQTGQRLIIRDGTLVSLKRILSGTELEEESKKITASISEYKSDQNYDVLLEWAKRNLDPRIIKSLIIPQINETDESKRKIQIEEVLTEIERTKDYYTDDFGSNSIIEWGKLSSSFLAYYINQNLVQWANRDAAIQELGINSENLEKYNRAKRNLAFRWFRWMEELSDDEKKTLSEVPTARLEQWKTEQFGMRIGPWSKEAQQLFTLAGLMMKPSLSIEEAKSWGTNEWLHYILSHESDGIVWRENYTLKNTWVHWKEMKERAVKRWDLNGEQLAAREFNVVSTAIWLGQMTMSNEHLLPNGRNSIWIPLEEAIGMLQYIRDRYGHPDIARKVYWVTWHYTHPIKWVQYKSFNEWY